MVATFVASTTASSKSPARFERWQGVVDHAHESVAEGDRNLRTAVCLARVIGRDDVA
jgi:hypothetical protein